MSLKPHRVIVAGSRSFTDYAYLENRLDDAFQDYIGQDIEIVCGGARGADELGKCYAIAHGIPYKVFLPDWKQHGKKAGPLRNIEMANYATELIAFWDCQSRGTLHMIDTAIAKQLDVTVIHIKHGKNG